MFKAEFYFKAYPIPLFVLFFAARILNFSTCEKFFDTFNLYLSPYN